MRAKSSTNGKPRKPFSKRTIGFAIPVIDYVSPQGISRSHKDTEMNERGARKELIFRTPCPFRLPNFRVNRIRR